MPNSLTALGLTTATQAELVANFTAMFQGIYGADITLTQDTPDGQLMMDFIQSILDIEDLLAQIYNSFDPDLAIGTQLDERCAINGIQRQAGTFTITNVTLVVSQAVSLFGLDQTVEPVYAVSDNAGNVWELVNTQNPPTPGSYVYVFQARNPGAVLTVPNTITIPVTIVLGVDSINNPTSYTTLGVNEESDAALRIRRQKSVSLSSQGYLAGLYGALENVPGVTFVNIQENNTDITDGDGTPSHTIWVIIAGSGEAADIAEAIYAKRNAGCGLRGNVTYPIVQVDGSTFLVLWDDVILEDLYIKFTATSLDGVNQPRIADIVAGLPSLFVPGVSAQVNINDLATAVQEIDDNTLVTNAGFSLSAGGAYTNTLTPSTKQKQFVVASNRIIVLPMILNPVTSTVAPADTVQFTGLGGYGALTYSISVNNSGGSINSSTGLYTAGATPSVVDTVLVTDTQAHTASATVNVT